MLGACGKPANWSTWWILDGNDDAECLRAVDYKASLNEAIVEMQRNFHLNFCKKYIWMKIYYLGLVMIMFMVMTVKQEEKVDKLRRVK